MAAFPCRTGSPAPTSPDHGHPSTSLRPWSSPSSKGRSRLPRLQALVKHHRFWRKMEREGGDPTEPQLPGILLAKPATFKQLLSNVFPGGDPGRCPPSGNTAVAGHRSSFLSFERCRLLPIIGPKENLPNGTPEQQGWESPASLFSVSVGALNSFIGVCIPSGTTNSVLMGAAFI